MDIETDLKCPHCNNNMIMEVFEIDCDTKLPTEGGFHLACDDLWFGNPCKYTYQEGVELDILALEWIENNKEAFNNF